jgi:hypothetical protein
MVTGPGPLQVVREREAEVDRILRSVRADHARAEEANVTRGQHEDLPGG